MAGGVPGRFRSSRWGSARAAAPELARVDQPPAMTLYVCTTCRDAAHRADAPAAGARFYANLIAADAVEGVAVVPVECLSVCKRTCAVGFAAPGKWTYVYGDLPADTAAATVLEGARLYAQTADGIIPWKQRPDALKKGAVARVPPLPLGQSAS